MEKNLQNRSYIKHDSITIAQRDIVTAVASPYIEALLEVTQNYMDIVPLIAYASHKFSGADSWQRWLLKQQPRGDITESVACMKDLSTIMQCLASIIFSGRRQLSLPVDPFRDCVMSCHTQAVSFLKKTK